MHMDGGAMSHGQVDGIAGASINADPCTSAVVHSHDQRVEHGLLAVRDQCPLHLALERLEQVGSCVIRSWPAQTTPSL